MLKSEVIGVAVLGVGRAGMVHARNFAEHVPEACLAGVYDADRERVEAVASELGTKSHYDLEELLQDTSIDAVVIAAPTFAHKDLVVAAAAAKKAILCEKPLALTPDEAEAMQEAVAAAGVPFVMGFMRRYDENFRRAKEIITRGDIGRPLIIKSTGKGPGLPSRWAWDVKKSNGVLGEVNSHDFDSVHWLMGAEYAWVFARGKNLRSEELKEEFPDFYDNAVVMFELTNGSLGMIDGSCPSEYGYDARIEIQGTEGVLFIGDIARHGLTVCTRSKGVTKNVTDSWRSLFRDAYLREDRHLVECLIKGVQPQTTLLDGKRALNVVRAANQSIMTGNVISL
ncbi:scyllo-inositol 2-dehydrogenase (NAD(+)) [Moorella thermoacetica]|uniref:Gfo/Idh/MocA family protein n=1 Tax=Neomoorella thermoacetica TaxID=1525 RepID=UPI0008FAB910|nr:Gfo/Idh/MocA family oxidoreductase [Moorella thermoacetica]OIQ11081.1 scyllo-inositol 2-dehydrogenase [Moorella thermoacetica]